MLCRNNLILILDANILRDILEIQEQTLNRAVMCWLEQTVEAMECKSKGKRIVLAVSTDVLKDYTAGIRGCRPGNPKAVIDNFFRRPSGRRDPVHSIRKIDLTIMKLQTVKITRRVFKDRDDQRYLELANAICTYSKLCSHHIIIATDDADAYSDLDENLLGRKNITLVGDIVRLEEAIKC